MQTNANPSDGHLTRCRLGDTNAAAVVALASGCGRPIELSDGAHRAGVWLLQLHPADSGAAATAHLLATPTHANCVLAPGDGCLYAGGKAHFWVRRRRCFCC